MSEKDNLPEAEGKPNDAANARTKENTASQELTATNENTLEESVEKPSKDPVVEVTKNDDEAVDEIENSNAKEAEEDTPKVNEEVSIKDYASMAMDALVTEFDTLLKSDEVQKIKDQAEQIKSSFNAKFSELLETKKKEFLDDGGNSIDFQFDFPLKKQFNGLYKTYRTKRQEYYNNLQKNLQSNLENRLEIIKEIKGLLNVEENINTTYKQFKALQERWRNAGPIPRDRYNNVWNNYHHHVENFYDFLHLNRDLRDLDFKHNLEQKQKIITQAEALAEEPDTNKAFRKLQTLHKIWKEELGPVAKEYRDDIWERFKTATKVVHEKRQVYFDQLEEVYKENLAKKNEIIDRIKQEAEEAIENHSGWQKKIKKIEALRQEFFDAGKVPIKVNEATWAKFKDAVREFNRKKNAFYKELKKEQFTNLQKKLDLIKVAEEHKDSDDFEITTPLMKRIQNEWKKIGHVPRKDSDRIWNQFKSACNHYFDKLRDQRNVANDEEIKALESKEAFLKTITKIKLTDNQDENLALINGKIEEWKAIGRVPRNKKQIDQKFQEAIDKLYSKMKFSEDEVEMLKYINKLERFASSDDQRLLHNELNFVRKKIDEIEGEINQLENNLQFFSNVASNNPLVKDVHSKIDAQKAALSSWKSKYNKAKQYFKS